IAVAVGQHSVRRAVVETAGEGNDVVDVGCAAEDLLHADGLAAIWAASVERIGRVQLLPGPKERSVRSGIGNAGLDQVGGVSLRLGRVAADSPLVLLPLRLALLQLPGQFDDDVIRPPVAGEEGVDDLFKLAQPDMDRWVRNLPPSDFRGVIRILGAGRNLPAEKLAV